MTLQTKLTQIPEAFLDLLFPKQCIGCGREGDFLCNSCTQTIPKLEPPYCECCGIPLIQKQSCPKCSKWPLQIDGIRSLFRHEELARDAAHCLKYNNLKALAKSLARLMAEHLELNPMPAGVLVAVPMHSKRIRKRGYNQAHLIANELAKLTQLEISEGSLIRLQNTPSQVSLGADERRKNVANAFQCKDQTFANRNVLLIDDVCTTGATLNACAIILKESGANSVWGLTFSRDC